MAEAGAVSAAKAEKHVPVLVEAVMRWLCVKKNGTYVDCTVGGGGHATAIATALDGGRLLALDRDPDALERARTRLAGFKNVSLHHQNYGELSALLASVGVASVDGVLIDAGVSSMQLDDPVRGFTLQEDGPLDMRLDRSTGQTAASYLADVSEAELTRVLRQYGDVVPARRIARAIVRRTRNHTMKTTGDLVRAVAESLDFVSGQPEETRTTFQAIRIAVNKELYWLEKGMNEAIQVLAPGGRLVVIAFHSGEDRIVKNVLRAAGRLRRELHADGRIRSTIPPLIQILTPKPETPNAQEVRDNPRAHSAKLRAAERLSIEGPYV